MNEEIFAEILPEQYLKRFLDNKIRQDGREIEERRKFYVSIQNKQKCDTYCILKSGNNMVNSYCNVNLMKKKLTFTQKKSKYINIIVKFSSQVYIGVHHMERIKREQELSTLIENIINQNYEQLEKLLQLAQQNNQYYWQITIDLNILSEDGNIFDSLLFAAQFSLFNVRLPQVKFLEDQEQPPVINNNELGQSLNISLTNFLIPLSYSILLGKNIIIDPNEYEEKNSDSTLTLISSLNSDNVILQVYGKKDIDYELFQMVEQKYLKQKINLKDNILKYFNDKSTNINF